MATGQRYQIIEKIAQGGMAEVFRGESAGIEGFRKQVAIKRVLGRLSANQDFISMFLDEARLCAFLNHSRCVQVFDIGQALGSHFIVMEFVDGADLKAMLDHLNAEGRSLPCELALFIASQVAEGLDYAHTCTDHRGQPLNIVHRDVSPHNVLITRFGEVKLVDFGLAKASSHLTDEDEGMVKGKFGYLAPEVCLGQGADHRVDIFAAGILLWEMLAGKRLFLGESDLETFKLVRAAEIPDIRQLRADVNEQVFRVLSRALARDPRERYASAGEFAKDLSLAQSTLRRPVCYQDVALVVKETATARKKAKKANPAEDDSFLGDVIIEALHGFSEHPEPTARPVRPPSRVAGGAFENPADWGLDDLLSDLALGSRPPSPAQAKPVQSAQPIAPEVPGVEAKLPPSPPGVPRAPAELLNAPRALEPLRPAAWWKRWWSA